MGVITTISSGSARTSGFCAVVQSCISEVAAKVRVLAQYIFEKIRSSCDESPEFFTVTNLLNFSRLFHLLLF